jgi:hypothetical protein
MENDVSREIKPKNLGELIMMRNEQYYFLVGLLLASFVWMSCGGSSSTNSPDGGDDGKDIGSDVEIRDPLLRDIPRCTPPTGEPMAVECPQGAWTQFDLDSLIVLNIPSRVSAGNDSIISLNLDGTYSSDLLSSSNNIVGSRDIAIDPISGVVLFSVSDWGSQTFVINELDHQSNVTMKYDFLLDVDNGGDISMAFDPQGNLFVAYNQYLYRKAAGSDSFSQFAGFPIDMVGIGCLASDQWGNLYWSDPINYKAVFRFNQDAELCVMASKVDGLNSPNGLAVDADNNLYIGNSPISAGPALITKIDANLLVTTYSPATGEHDSLYDLHFDAQGNLYGVSGFYGEIIKFESDWTYTSLAGESQHVSYPESLLVVRPPVWCQ